MTLKEAMEKLKSLGDEKRRAHNARSGAGDNQFGVPLGDIRTLAKKIKPPPPTHELALDLWKTGNIDAQLLAILLMKPKALSAAEMDGMVRSVTFVHVADWLNAYVVKNHPDNETLRERWMADDDSPDAANPMAARAGWSLTAGRIEKGAAGGNEGEGGAGGLDPVALLDRIESEMGDAAPEVQWTMNATLAAIGINFAEHRKRAIAIGEKLGIYRDYPCSKGCTSPFAPIWINEMVKRKG